jgi:hypothetical protein
MPEDKPRLRGQRPSGNAPHELGAFSESTIEAVARQIVHRLAVGHADITGDDWGTIFARSISGEHRGSPLGLADVVWENCGWSVKTIQHKNPYSAKKMRFISGRNSPDFSFGIQNPMADIQATGDAVLKIWNARVNESRAEHSELRTVILVRNMSDLKFMLFEDEIVRFQPNDYKWTKNAKDNLIGTHTASGVHCFTWQKHGSQFTIHRQPPPSAVKFSLLKRPRLIEEQHIINLTGFDETWVLVEPRS